MYDEGSCELSYKPFYHPIEAAIRWCGLLDNEAEILHAFALAPHTLSTAFPQWPCLYLNLEKLHDAVANKELRYGSLGIPVKPDSGSVTGISKHSLDLKFAAAKRRFKDA